MYRPRTFESADTVNRVVALLVRFPEIHSVRANPVEATVTLSFAVRGRLDGGRVRAFADAIAEHVRAFVELRGETPEKVALGSERDNSVTFLHVTRDAATFVREELELQVALFTDRFGAALVRNPAEEPIDEEPDARDDVVEAALEALRDPGRDRLVGFREEKRVLVYFLHGGGRRGARARS